MAVHRISLLLAALLLVILSATGCDKTNPSLITVLDVTPRDVDLGDRVEILGIDFPEGKPAEVVFAGELRRAGEPPKTGFSVRVSAESSSASRVGFHFTQGLQDRFAGVGNDAVHTTFVGTVSVVFQGESRPVQGLKQVTLDVRPPSTRRAITEAREKQGEKALAFLGITESDASPTSGGLAVASVAAGSIAERAGMEPGDVLIEFEKVTVFSRADIRPGGGRLDRVPVRVNRAGVVRDLEVDMTGFARQLPTDLLASAIVLLVALLIVGVFMAPTAGIITWVERRVSGRMQSRIGPNRTGPQGFLQWLADGIKSILKEDIIPTEADRPLFRLAPYLVFVGVSATFVVMPFGEHLIAADLDIGILYVVAVTSLVTIGLMTGGWASNNKWSLLGGIRSAAQIISYEIPGAIAIVCIVMMTGSMSLQEIIRAQGGWPWDWYMFHNPITLLLFFLYFTTALAEGNRAPFDLPEAESELVAGYSTEYSGMRYVFFFFAEWANVFVMSGIASALFLGGWQVPGHELLTPVIGTFWLQALGAFLFLTKSWVLIFVVIWVRWTLPRIRIDQLMNLCWKWLVPGAFAAFGLLAVWTLWLADLAQVGTQWPRQVASVLTFVFFLVLMAYFGWRVAYNLRSMRSRVHVNPFI